MAPRSRTTSTVDEQGRLVPWLAASGDLAYAPECPPERDYYFQYGWVLPQVIREERRRRHFFFGARSREDAQTVFAFWEAARAGKAQRVFSIDGARSSEVPSAPLATYRFRDRLGRARYMLIQHGSYQAIEVEQQPALDEGTVRLYRGIGNSRRFEVLTNGLQGDGDLWRCYGALQWHVLADSVRSFNSIHDRTKRCETGHILDDTWISDDLAAEYGLDLRNDAHAGALWREVTQSYTLVGRLGEWKFGPNFVELETSVDNIRITTFFAGEFEVRVVDPRRVEVVRAVGCEVHDSDVADREGERTR